MLLLQVVNYIDILILRQVLALFTICFPPKVIEAQQMQHYRYRFKF